MTKTSKYLLPILLVITLYVLYYVVFSISEEIIFEMIFIDVLGNVFIALVVFGMLVYGLLGIIFSRIYFPIHRFLTRSKGLEKHYIILNTGYEVTGGLMVKRAFLLYCIAFSLSLTTIQFLRYFLLFPDPGTQQELFITSYTGLIFLYSFILAAILSPIYYFADLNIMFYTRHEGMTFLVPFGTKVLPVLKGFGSFSIIISFLVFVIDNFNLGDVPLTVTLDPLITLFIPILFVMGFEIASPLGKKHLKKWLERMEIEAFDDLSINLTKKEKEYNNVPGSNDTPN